MSKILIVEDEESIAELEKDYLELSGFEVEIENDGEAGLKRAISEEFDLFILDLMLPGVDGFEICKKIRETKNTPVIMISAKKDDIDKIRGLGLGADDYITKPFGVMELMSRVKAVLRRSAKKVKTVLVYKNIELDENKHTVLVDGAEVDLTYKEYEILKHLIRNKGIVLTRDRLMEIVWGYNFEQGNRTVDVHIQSLRKKLGTAGEHIKTIRNVGYKVGE